MAQLSQALRQATPLRVVSGRGTTITTDTGETYLDATSGIGVTSTGHCHPRVVGAAQQQTGKLIHGQYGVYLHDRLPELMEALSGVLPEHLSDFFFANSGAEAVESAVRLARNATGRQNVVVFQGSFHGRTIGASALTTSGARFRAAASGPLPTGVVIAPFPSAFRYGWSEEEANRFALQELHHILATLTTPDDVAAILVEPILGEAGYLPGNAEFFSALREIADEYGMLLIFDEVQAGVGRTGKFWAHEHFGVAPDIIVFAKGIASGFPLSGIAARPEIMAKALPGSQGGTYSANAVACAAAIETISVIADEDLVGNAARRGQRLRDGLVELSREFPVIGDVRGLGLMQAVELVGPNREPVPDLTSKVLAAALERKVIMLACGPYGSIVRMIPALVITEAEVDRLLEVWREVLVELAGPR
ncbi:aspartate aminotransferase family protein [Leucobacter sp. wl10]|uniref:aspartate aminotransferase family protein n=1 Tax=Leucobacter sp. wl10 TaxID=2304677 RepID=UPI000E5C2830|nr:aspartate aminotransferase family protein [Leucobacter sp. wl10]RGE22043.1 aspartate aminotransferase family protein [Leucobacter sp. wl10]